MFSPYFLTEQDFGMYPEVDVRTDEHGGIALRLVFNSRVLEVLFSEIIAFNCIEESIYELSLIPGMPTDVEFAHQENGATKTPVWKSSVNFRRGYYGHLDSYCADAPLESYLIFGADYVVLVESIGSVDVKFAT
ncbi:hypothetical protein [Arsukibacterium sp.]|uniref:hypothetical protein n=1 Tax=Arsukibacterium sp. TaxID=1977258 RepID=UPI00299DFDC3|nr:hypothetical protein [Arsukibacterium sp.]MDX1537118.1 hypothetical protein [Arsukibacterium sp.]